MGIDPNNHKLHQSFPRPQMQPVSGGASSTESMNKDRNKKKVSKSCGTNNDRVSDTESCLEEETLGSSRLNLDLTIAFPASGRLALVEDKPKPKSESNNTKEMDSDLAPTLLLFR